MSEAVRYVADRPAAVSAPGTQRRTRWLAAASAYAGLLLLAAFFLLPLAFMFVGSLKPNDRVLAEGHSWRAFVPAAASLENYREAFRRANFGHLFFNSVLISGTIVLAGLVVNSLFGYALARFRFPGKNKVLAAIIALIIVPLEAYAIPLLYMMAKVRLIDTYTVQILPFIANPFFIYLFYTFYLSFPKELEEAARVDGAGPVTIFARIAVPLARPAYATVAILSFLFAWGQLLWPVLVTRGPEVRPLPLGMAEFQNLPPILWGQIMAYAAMMTLPLLVLFLAFQSAFVRGVARTGLKG